MKIRQKTYNNDNKITLQLKNFSFIFIRLFIY